MIGEKERKNEKKNWRNFKWFANFLDIGDAQQSIDARAYVMVELTRLIVIETAWWKEE